MKNTIVFSLGGSVIVPDAVDYNFLREFKVLIRKIAKRHKVVIVTGGGKTAREYINALKKANASIAEQDSIGIEATWLNAKLLAGFFNLKQNIPVNINQVMKLAKKQDILICGGMLRGTTTDGVAAVISSKLNACCIINITKAKGLYDKDPLKHPDARLIRRISYSEAEKMLNKIKEKPGQHFIIDRLALETASKNKIRIIILGKNIKNIARCISNKRFEGTIIS